MRYDVEATAVFRGELDSFDDRTDRIADEFHGRADVADMSVGATLSTGIVEFTMIVEADMWGPAREAAWWVVRDTLVSAGEDVADWDVGVPERAGEDG